MNDFKHTMQSLRNRIHLSADEKSVMKGRIREYMMHMPKRAYAPRQSMFTLLVHYRFSAALVALALIFTSGVGVSYAAQGALPGEALYAVKQAREEVREKLLFDEERRTEYVIERAHERLQEVEQLAAAGKLNTATEKIATERFEQLRERAQTRIATLAETHPARADALQLALAVGINARTEVLAVRSEAVPNMENDARERVALAVAGDVPATMQAPSLSALRAAPQAMMEAESVVADGVQADTAIMALSAPKEESLPTQAQIHKATPLSAEAVNVLVRILNTQRDKLKDVHAKSTGETQEQIATVLQDVARLQKDIAAAVRARNYEKAQDLVERALRMIHTARAGLEVSHDVRANVPLTPAIENTQRLKFEDVVEEPGPPSAPANSEVRDLPIPSRIER